MVDALTTFLHSLSSSIFFLSFFGTDQQCPGRTGQKFAPSDGDIAQLARAMALQAIGRGFESHYLQYMPERGSASERFSLTYTREG